MMPGAPSPIFLMTGPPGAGKTTVAKSLLQTYPLGLHIPVDELREDWVVSGLAHPAQPWTDETLRQVRLSRQAVAKLACMYSDEGFAVVIDDFLFPADIQVFFTDVFVNYRVHKVLLLPSLQTCMQRNAERVTKSFDTSVLANLLQTSHQIMIDDDAFPKEGWIVVDNSDLTVAQTAQAILRGCSGAKSFGA
jgi:tRNA uridine 5-carbamoylmethylation protein Kti12